MWPREHEDQPRDPSEGRASRRRRGRGFKLPGPLVPILVLAAVAFLVAQLGGFSSSGSGPRVGETVDSEWTNPGLQAPAGQASSATARVLVRIRPQQARGRDAAARGAIRKLDARQKAGAVSLEDGSTWHALELDQPQPLAEIQRALDGTGAVTVIADPPRWPLEQPLRGERFAEQWSLHSDTAVDVNAPEAWELSQGSEDVVVAVIDSGVDRNHPELRDVLLPGHNVTDVGGPADVRDESGHGTAVAAIIAARGAVMNGLAPRVRILPIKVFGTDYYTTSADIAQAVDLAVEGGADIVNLSLGCSPRGADPTGVCHSEVERAAIERARDAGVLVVAAAGNSGTSNDEVPSYPQNYEVDNILNVAASDRDGSLADWSNRGERSVHVAAPGVRMLVSLPGGKYAISDGTSFAAPVATAAAALLRMREPGLDAAGLRAAVMRAATPVPALEGKVAMAAVIDAERAARAATGVNRPIPEPGPDIYLAEHGSQPTVTPRSARIAGPADRARIGAAGRPNLRWSLPGSTDVYELAISRSARTIKTPFGAWLEENSHGQSWAAARRIERYRPAPLPAGTYWWQVVTWDDAALQLTFSDVRRFTVPARVRMRNARTRVRGRTVNTTVRIRSSTMTTRLRVEVFDGARRVGRRTVAFQSGRGGLWSWKQRRLKFRLGTRPSPGTRLHVRMTAIAGPTKAVTRQRTRVRGR